MAKEENAKTSTQEKKDETASSLNANINVSILSVFSNTCYIINLI